MKAEDRVMSKQDILNLYKGFHRPFESALETQRDYDLEIAKAQAKITAPIFFEAGRKAMIREVVEWIKPKLNYRVLLIDPAHPVFGYELEVSEKEWEAKLKEWGIDKEEVKDE